MFDNMGRLQNDATDQSQRNVYNTRLSNYMLSDFFSSRTNGDSVQFATSQPNIFANGTALGHGLNGTNVDTESLLKLKTDAERPLEKLQLVQRPFLTVPYLGRGSCDPSLESQIMQGEIVRDHKSVTTIMDKSFQPYTFYPTDQAMEEHIHNYSLDDWRIGIDTRNSKL
jgi:hypothetical protein